MRRYEVMHSATGLLIRQAVAVRPSKQIVSATLIGRGMPG